MKKKESIQSKEVLVFNVEEIQSVAQKLLEINKVPLNRIELTQNGVVIPLSNEMMKNKVWAGIDNCMFINESCYKDICDEGEDQTFDSNEKLLKVSFEDVNTWSRKKQYWMSIHLQDDNIEVYKEGKKLELNPDFIADLKKSGDIFQTLWNVFCTDSYLGNLEYELMSNYNHKTKDYDTKVKVSIPYLNCSRNSIK